MPTTNTSYEFLAAEDPDLPVYTTDLRMCGERVQVKMVGYLAYEPDQITEMAKFVLEHKSKCGIEYDMGHVSEETIIDFRKRIVDEYKPVDNVNLWVEPVASTMRGGIFKIGVWLNYKPTVPPIIYKPEATIYTNPNVPRKEYMDLVPMEARDKQVTVVSSYTYDTPIQLRMRSSVSKHRVFCGKFPRKVETDVLPDLLAAGVNVDVTKARYI